LGVVDLELAANASAEAWNINERVKLTPKRQPKTKRTKTPDMKGSSEQRPKHLLDPGHQSDKTTRQKRHAAAAIVAQSALRTYYTPLKAFCNRKKVSVYMLSVSAKKMQRAYVASEN
jgi:hypothetical protein